MNLFVLVWSYLKAKPLNTALNTLLLALGIAVITVLILFGNQLRGRVEANVRGIDLVVGSKGSPLQLILCSIFHVDFPTGNIKLNEAEQLATHRLIKQAIPLALGDSYQGYRIVGTTRAYTDLYGAELASGRWWQNDLELVAGANVAAYANVRVGDKLMSQHGLGNDGHAHEGHKIECTGILKKTNSVLDNLLFTNIGTVWAVHEEQETHGDHRGPDSIPNPSVLVPGFPAGDSTREITSLLVEFRNPLAAIQLPRYINTQTNMQAASPAFEMARLFSLLGVGADVLLGFAYVIIFISGLSLFIALYNSLRERQYDLAIMRSMGASRTKLFVSIVAEGVSLTLAGSALGVTLGHLVVWAFTQAVPQSGQTGFTAWVFYAQEGWLLAGSLGLGLVCSLLPAIQAYRTNIHRVLAG
jgi:putative ABC transport system permease protein